MKKISIPQNFLDFIFLEAERAYPAECCGMILGFSGNKTFSRVQSVKNIQDQVHAEDPVRFPRTSRQAFLMDPRELLTIQKELRASHEEIRVIYHSHPEVPAVFSSQDRQMAVWQEEPVYPGSDYLIVSVVKGKVKEAFLYRWDPVAKDFCL